MYKDRHGIYYRNFIDRLLGKASPSLNMAHGGMAALQRRAVNNFMGYGEKKNRKYAVYAYDTTYLAVEVKKHEKL